MPQNQMLFFPSFRVDFYPAGRMFASAGLQLGQGYPGTLFRVGNGFVRGELAPLQTASAAPLPSPGRDGHRSGRPWPIKPEHDKRMAPRRTVMEGAIVGWWPRCSCVCPPLSFAFSFCPLFIRLSRVPSGLILARLPLAIRANIVSATPFSLVPELGQP